MNIDDLRRRNKQVLVDHAFVIYGITPEKSLRKSEWVDYLIDGGNFELMLEMFKWCRESVFNGMPKPSDRAGQIYNDLVSAIRMREVA